VRTPPAIEVEPRRAIRVGSGELQIRNIEETVLQADVDGRANRVAQAQNTLPGNPALTVGKADNAVWRGCKRVHLHVGNADACTSIAAEAIFIAEVEQQI